MYRTKEYSERPWDEIKAEIDMSAKYYPESRRIFFADGDALNLPTESIVKALTYVYAKFPKLERVSCYAMPMNILHKSESELREITAAGLKMLYIGIESGNDVVLRKVTKGATYNTIVQACQRAKAQGFVLSCMIILGLGGATYTKVHILDTARILSRISPEYVGALTLYLEEGVHNEFLSKFGEPFVHLDDLMILDELEKLILNIVPENQIIFRANHASNVYSIAGILPDDREKLLSLVRNLKLYPQMLKPKSLRRF